jgi:hypothetical protein
MPPVSSGALPGLPAPSSSASAISLAVGRIESIHRSRKAIYENQTTIQKALDELKYIPVDED